MAVKNYLLIILLAVIFAACASAGEAEVPDVGSSPDTQPTVECTGHDQCPSQKPCLAGRCTDNKCAYIPVEGECDDSAPCTQDDSCADGKCQGVAVDCNNESYCDGRETCDPLTGQCVSGPAPIVDDGIDCTLDWCDEDLQGVVHSPDHESCFDENPCTLNLCSMQQDCTSQFLDGPCDDDDPCTEEDWCTAGECVPGEWNCFEICDNELDDDGDDAVDCDDDECAAKPECAPDVEVCDDELDNDGDDKTDCEDEDCSQDPACPVPVEICFDGIDNDGDGAPDCLDEDCDGHPKCQPVTNDTCQEATLLNDGMPLTSGDVPAVFTFEGATWTAADDTVPPCADNGPGPGDVVFEVAFDKPLVLKATAKFAGPAWAALYVLDSQCQATAVTPCETGGGQPVELQSVLPSGTWFIVVDGAWPGDAGAFQLSVEVLPLPPAETVCHDGQDNDFDGQADCKDSDCAQTPACTDPYEPNDTFETSAALGALHAGQEMQLLPLTNISNVDDEDWFIFSSSAPGWVVLDVSPEAGLDVRIAVFGEQPTPLDSMDISPAGVAESLTITAASPGVFRMRVDGAAATSGQYGATLQFAPAPGNEENCLDGTDNDLDGKEDCVDPDCASLAICGGGDKCLVPLLVNDGLPVSTPPGIEFEYEGTTVDHDNDSTGSCSPKSSHAPDAVWKVVLAKESLTTATVVFHGPAWPSVYLRESLCDGPDVACGKSGTTQTASTTATVGPGEVFVVVDGDWDQAQSDYTLTLEFATAVPESKCQDGKDDDLDGATDCCDSDCATVPACIAEPDCTDGADEDCDGLIDCADPDCSFQWMCLGFSCDTPFLVHEEGAIGKQHSGLDVQLEGATQGLKEDHQGTCSTVSAAAEDVVWAFSLADAMFTTITLEALSFKFPVLYLFKGDCGVPSELVCKLSTTGSILLSNVPLEPGDYFVVIDANVAQAAFEYNLSLSFEAVADEETDCADGLDEDLDGLVDCVDPDCSLAPECEGESCTTPYQLNQGVALTEADDGLLLSTSGDTSTMASDHTGSCSIDSQECADAVYRFQLADRLRVTVSSEFEGLEWPALYILGQDCDNPVELGCKTAALGAAVWTAILVPGTYHIVVDAAFIGDAGPFEMTALFEIPKETDCADGADNDDDDLVDCHDADCADEDVCAQETCTSPGFLNDGQPIGLLDDGLWLVATGDTDGMTSDYAGTCSESSAEASDAVWAFQLEHAMEVAVEYDFDTAFLFPAVYLFSTTCVAESIVGCAVSQNEAATFVAQLSPGTYYVVADADFGGDAGPYTLSVVFSAP